MLFDEFDQYCQTLLLAQYEISEIIQHELTKGEVREDFLINILKSRFEPSPNLQKGTISDGSAQAGQIDIMLCRPNVEIFRLGTQAIIRPDDCLCLIEVKGNARGNDIREFNNRIGRIKQMRAERFPLFGIFCYKVELQEQTILNRFGYYFSMETQTYFDDELHPKGIDYPNIDFFVSLDKRCPLFLRKNTNGRFLRILDYPILKNVFQIIRSLIRPLDPL